jgi:hypothetical protein
MKVITLIQPYATLIALGEKGFETRSWPTKHRGELLIHAEKKVDKFICQLAPFNAVLAKHGLTADTLPIGVIIAKVNLTDCHAIYEEHAGSAVLMDKNNSPVHWVGKDSNEYAFGDFSDGRFAFKLSDVEQIEHIPAKGQLGLWNYSRKE